ncbi:MAG: 3-oxoacid CoA-transferase subunit B [Negativicutes bacterium]|nr:3-oxoacid CoA-transferase subunit B [Negativicutes bacterium]
MDAKEVIARRAALELADGDVVNLGIGLPTLVADYIPAAYNVILQSENGIIGMDRSATGEMKNAHIVNAGGLPVTVRSHASFFDSAESFSIIRGGHLDKTILGALEVDETGSLASHIIPGKLIPGMGGAMDLAAGAKRVIVVTTHTAKGEAAKILKRCRLPLTAKNKVNLIITELAVLEVTAAGLLLREIRKGLSLAELRQKTEADFAVAMDLKEFGE